MKKIALIATLLISTTAFALPEDFSFSGDVKLAGKHQTRKEMVTPSQDKKGDEAPLAEKDQTKKEVLIPYWHNEENGNFEVNLLGNYKQDLGWAASKIKIANKMEKTKFTDTFNCQKLLVGSDFYERGATRWYGECGRQPLSDRFESAVQFNRRFDGLYTEFSRPVGRFGTYVAQGGGMIVNLDKGRFGWIGMTGLDDIWGTGAYTRVSMTRWDAHNQPIQLLAGYRFQSFWGLPKGRVYMGYIINVGKNKKTEVGGEKKEQNVTKVAEQLRNKRDNQAGYLGAQLGNIQKKGDWSLKLEMRLVEGKALYKDDATGKNFWGPVSEVGYAFTDHFSARLKLQHSNCLSRKLPGDRSNSQIEGKFVLTF